MIDASYFLFIGCLLFLLAFSTKRDRASLWIIVIASIVGVLMVLAVTRNIHEPWKLAFPGALETLTILALVTLSEPNRHTTFQVLLLLIAWCAHLLCYVDCQTGSNVVYDHYEQILAGVALAQLLGFHDTALSLARSIQKWCYLWAVGGRGVSAASGGVAVVHNQAKPGA